MSQDGCIFRHANIMPRERGGGARSILLVKSSAGARSMLNGITEIDPGAAIPLHFHNCEESVLVLEGAAIATIGGREYLLAPNDTSWIAAGVHHFFRNPSATEKLRIFWTYASIDATRTLVATGETHRIDEEHAGDPGGGSITRG